MLRMLSWGDNGVIKSVGLSGDRRGMGRGGWEVWESLAIRSLGL